LRSPACGSFTFTIMSALAKISSAVAMILAPACVIVGVAGADAFAGIRLHPDLVAVAHGFRTDTGVMPTRYSWFLISFGTPMSIFWFPPS
jgi:hypothetical protein